MEVIFLTDKTTSEDESSGFTMRGLYGLNSLNINYFNNINNPSSPGDFISQKFSRINPASLMTTLIFIAGIIALAGTAGVVSAYPAIYLESGNAWGYTPGDVSGLKDEYPAEFQYYHISWIKIVPESDTDEWGVESDYFCTLKTPHGKEIYIRPGIDVFYTPSADEKGGLFNDGGLGYYSVNISGLVAGAKADMIPWRGTWTIEYYFNQEDSKNPPDYVFVANTTFKIYDDSTQTPTPTPEMVTPKPASTVPEGFIPAESYTSDTSGGNFAGRDVTEITVKPAADYTETPDYPDGINTTGSGGNDGGIYIWVIAAVALIIAVVVIVRIKTAKNRDDYYL